MPFPQQPTEFLQDVIRRWVNREVKDYFNDEDITDSWSPNLNAPRSALAAACLHQDTDSLLQTVLRWMLFKEIKEQLYRQPYYGIPVTSFQEQRRFQPQIMLYFVEDAADVEPGFEPVTGEISFRVMEHTSQTLTPTIAQIIATRIRAEFATGGGYVWRKGKVMCSYSDWKKGYQFQLLCRTVTDGREIVTKVLDALQDVPDWKKFNFKENAEPASAYPTIPGTDYIYGETRRLSRKRPIADVRFQSAFLHIHGLPNPLVLVDRTGTWSNPVVT